MTRFSIKYLHGWVGSILAVLLLTFPVHGETKTGDKWHFQLGTYGWLSGQKGTLATEPGLPAADVDLDFYDDIAGNINGAFSLIGEARKGRYGIITDINYSDIEDDEATPGPLFSTLTSRTKTWIASLAGFYRLLEQNRAFLDGVAGLRYWSVDSSLKLGAIILPARESSNREDCVCRSDSVPGRKGHAGERIQAQPAAQFPGLFGRHRPWAAFPCPMDGGSLAGIQHPSSFRNFFDIFCLWTNLRR